MKPIYRKLWAAIPLMSDLTLDPSFKIQTRIAKLKSAYTHLLLVLEVWDDKPTYRKSWAGSLLVWSHLTFGPSSRSNEDSQS